MLTVVTKHANFLETFALKSRTLLLKRVVAGGWSLSLCIIFNGSLHQKIHHKRFPLSLFYWMCPSSSNFKICMWKKNLGRLSTPTKQQTVASFDTNQEVSIRFWSILMSLQTSNVAFDKWVHSRRRGIIIISKTK